MKIETAKTMLKYAKQHVEFDKLRVAQTKESWVYLTDQKVIGVALYVSDDEEDWNKWMINYIAETFDYEIAEEHMEIFSLFHELGHHVVGDICTPLDYQLLLDEVPDGDYYEYRQIPDEYAADEWAINFLKEHMTELLELNR